MRKMAIDRRGLFALGAGSALLTAAPRLAWAQDPVSPVDALVRGFMRGFEVPGVGIALVSPDGVFTRGYGVRALGRPGLVDQDTLFAIASNTKAMTATAMALLVEAGKLEWDAPVRRFLPEFAMSDAHATEMMTVRDLLVHRSGLALGAGDLMFFPASTHTPDALMRGLKHLPLARGFRSGYAYDNVLYVIAGVLIERISGQRWDEFITARILRPLGMRTAVATRALLRTSNVAGRHARLGPPLRGFGRLERIEPAESVDRAAAGGVHASVRDIVPWLQAQLGRGQLPGRARLWSEQQADEMWTPQVITAATTGPIPEAPTRSVLQGYALGWFISQYRDRRLISHSGGWSGQITQTALLPEQGMAVAVFTNTEDGAASSHLRNALLDHLLGVTGADWLALGLAAQKKGRDAALKEVAGSDIKRPGGGPSLPLDSYAGRYRDPWYGDILILRQGAMLSIDFTHTLAFKGPLEPWGKDAFRTRWARGAGEDAVLQFRIARGRVTGIKMKALSPLADFSYDFHDLVLTRVD